MTTDPWAKIDLPQSENWYRFLGVDVAAGWDFRWAKRSDGSLALVLLLNDPNAVKLDSTVPNLRGVEILILEPQDNFPQARVVFLLKDTENRDIFYQLCLDIIASSRAAENEKQAVTHAIQRSWRWHYLLRGGASDRLSIEEQKGLIGEMLILENILLPHFNGHMSLDFWQGPHGAPKDFEIGSICVESKARRGAAIPYVSISNEYQLDIDSAEIEALYLHIVELNRAPSDTENAFTITDIAKRIRENLEAEDISSGLAFEAVLQASGFDFTADYSDFAFQQGGRRVFVVEDDFPRVTPSHFLPGVSRVSYALSLSDIERFEMEYEGFVQKIKGLSDDKSAR